MGSRVTFGVMTDLHSEIIHDAEKRIEAFTTACAQNHVDFGVQLGDFTLPDWKGYYLCEEERVSDNLRNTLSLEEKTRAKRRGLLNLLSGHEFSTYHVLGNHDMDLHSIREVLDFYGMENASYSFDQNGFHFVVLDTNYGLKDGKEFSFEHGLYRNWVYQPEEPYPYVPKKELMWLEKDLENTDKPVILLSHSGLNGAFLNVLNHEEVFDILTQTPGKVILCINGHKHQDILAYERGIPVVTINSISGVILHPKYARERFDRETEETYPNLKCMAVYSEPLFAMVTIDENTITIKGKQTTFVPPSPQDLGARYKTGELTASISDIVIRR